jgi:hypothetical protein
MAQSTFARRPSATWKLNRFREYLLIELLSDLKALEVDGLSFQECSHVQSCLDQLVNECRTHSHGPLLEGPLTSHLTEFARLYHDWNGPQGRTAEATIQRENHLRRLTRRRRRMSSQIGRHQLRLSGIVDDRFCDELWNRLEAIPRAFPGDFPRLQRGFRRVRAAMEP